MTSKRGKLQFFTLTAVEILLGLLSAPRLWC